METKEQILALLQDEKHFLESTYKVKRIGLFGSFANGQNDSGSDIDLLVEFYTTIGMQFFSLADYLEKKLKRKIDLLTVEGVNSIRQDNISDSIKCSVIYA